MTKKKNLLLAVFTERQDSYNRLVKCLVLPHSYFKQCTVSLTALFKAILLSVRNFFFLQPEENDITVTLGYLSSPLEHRSF